MDSAPDRTGYIASLIQAGLLAFTVLASAIAIGKFF